MVLPGYLILSEYFPCKVNKGVDKPEYGIKGSQCNTFHVSAHPEMNLVV